MTDGMLTVAKGSRYRQHDRGVPECRDETMAMRAPYLCTTCIIVSAASGQTTKTIIQDDEATRKAGLPGAPRSITIGTKSPNQRCRCAVFRCISATRPAVAVVAPLASRPRNHRWVGGSDSLRWGRTRQGGRIDASGFRVCIEMGEDPSDHRRTLDAGNEPHGHAAGPAGPHMDPPENWVRASGFRAPAAAATHPSPLTDRLGSRLCENPRNLSPSGTAPHLALRKAPLTRSSRHSGSISP